MSSKFPAAFLVLALAYPGKAAFSVFDFSLASLDGKSVPLKQYDGNVVLIVNLASQSGYADQITKLEALYERYQQQGFVVLGVPSNDFGAQEPDNDIAKVYAGFKIKFPLFGRAAVIGKDQLPLYKFFSGGKPPDGDEQESESSKADSKPAAPGPPSWNFTKYLVDRKGKTITRFDADIAPDSPQLMSAIEEALNAKPEDPPSPPAQKISGIFTGDFAGKPASHPGL